MTADDSRTRQTGFLCDSFFALHETGDHPESPRRIVAIQEGVAAAGLLPKLAMIGRRDAVEAEITLVHSADYFRRVEEDVRLGEGQLSTGDTVISERSMEVALRATGGVLNAVDAVVGGRIKNAFCAVRPPGHHASPARGRGFCIFNHVAIAARYVQKKHGVGKILIVDWDVHHGNGTQDAFYADDSVLFFSSHQHPWYPGTGMREETGTERGLGYTVNAPLPAGSGLVEIVNAMEGRLEPKVRQFRPELVLISAGFDSRVDDPLGQFTLTDEDFAALTGRVKEWAGEFARGRIVSILEGGYNLETLGGAVAARWGRRLADSERRKLATKNTKNTKEKCVESGLIGKGTRVVCGGDGKNYNPGMKILLNGRDYEIPAGTTIAGLVKLREIKTPAYAVERNAQVVFRKEHEAVRLNEGDKVEIVVAVGGG